MWQGILGLKNDNCVVQMHFIAGCRPLVKLSLPQQGPDGTVQPLRIAQRMRLEQAQLDGVAKRMQVRHSPFLHYWLVPSLEEINIGNAGNQIHPDLEVRVVLVTCTSNIDF